MPRFYFDLQHEPDDFGSDLADVAAAHVLARRYAGELLCDGRSPVHQNYWRVDVRQGAGPVIFSLVIESLPNQSNRGEWPSTGTPVPDEAVDWV